MKARRKSDGEIIKVEAIVYNAKNGERYSPSELDFNVDSEDTVIQGWVCRDKYWQKDLFASDLCLAMEKPKRDKEMGMWYDLGKYIPLSTDLFPDLTWDSEPEQVEIILKRKKNGEIQ